MTMKVFEKRMPRNQEIPCAPVNLACQTAHVSPFVGSVLLI